MKGFVGFLIGAAIGSVTTFFVTRYFDNKKNDEEIKKLEQYYEDKIPKKVPDVQAAETAIEEKPAEEAVKLEEKKQYEYDRIHKVEGEKIDYRAAYKSVITRKEDDDPIPDGNKPYLDSDVDNEMAQEIQGMIIVSAQEWEEDDEFEKREVTYFPSGEVFVDQFGQEIKTMTPDDAGRPNLDHFGISGEEGVLFLRDMRNMTDYKVYLDESEWYSVDE